MVLFLLSHATCVLPFLPPAPHHLSRPFPMGGFCVTRLRFVMPAPWFRVGLGFVRFSLSCRAHGDAGEKRDLGRLHVEVSVGKLSIGL